MSGASSGQRGRGAKSSGSARPRRSRSIPAQATITALSVQSRAGGATSAKPFRAAAAPSAVRIAALAATPPATTKTRPSGCRAANVAIACAARSASTSATAAWNEAARIRRDRVRQRAVRLARDRLRHRRLQSGEAEVAAFPAEHRPWQGESGRIAAVRQALERRAAGPGQAEQLGDLVERLARRVVHRAAEPEMAADALYRDALAVPARNQQQQIGKRRAAGHETRQAGGERVRLEMVDRDVGHAGADRDAAREPAADDQPPDQTRPAAGGDATEIARGDPRHVHHAPDDAWQVRQMRPRRDLGHHAAIGRVLPLLAKHVLGEDAPVRCQHGGGRLVAATLDPKDRAGEHPPCLSFSATG